MAEFLSNKTYCVNFVFHSMSYCHIALQESALVIVKATLTPVSRAHDGEYYQVGKCKFLLRAGVISADCSCIYLMEQLIAALASRGRTLSDTPRDAEYRAHSLIFADVDWKLESATAPRQQLLRLLNPQQMPKGKE